MYVYHSQKVLTRRAVVVHACNPSTLGGRGRRISEFEASLVYRVSSRIARATQRTCLEKTNKQKKCKRQKIKHERELQVDLFSTGTKSLPLVIYRLWLPLVSRVISHDCPPYNTPRGFLSTSAFWHCWGLSSLWTALTHDWVVLGESGLLPQASLSDGTCYLKVV